MTSSAVEEVKPRTEQCPECKKTMRLQFDVDGIGRPRTDLQRFPHHAGKRWGRACRMSGELHA